MPAVLDAPKALPAYDSYLRAYHTAFAPELTSVVRRYKTTARTRVLDVPCGDGFYSALFARHMRGGTLVAADVSPDYLAVAESNVPNTTAGPAVAFRQADVYAMPFADESFDLIWCAQSMISLDDPVKALREMGRVLAPGGRIAVLESDEYHHVLLPWPVGLEMAIHRAVKELCQRKYGSAGKFAQARKLRAAFLDAGLRPSRKTTVAADRQAPFARPVRLFLEEHFAYLRKMVRGGLTGHEAKVFDRFVDPHGEDSLLNRADAEVTVLAMVSHARR
jgi:ubiquinone/menaquinone biosynthesis C-methylase UbiE